MISRVNVAAVLLNFNMHCQTTARLPPSRKRGMIQVVRWTAAALQQYHQGLLAPTTMAATIQKF